MDDEIPTDLWIYYCAQQLKHHWRTVDPEQLEELAADLAGEPHLRAMSPVAAARLWLEPVTPPPHGEGAKGSGVTNFEQKAKSRR